MAHNFVGNTYNLDIGQDHPVVLEVQFVINGIVIGTNLATNATLTFRLDEFLTLINEVDGTR